MTRSLRVALCFFAACCGFAARSLAAGAFDAKNHAAKASFELVVAKSSSSPAGTSRIQSQSAFVSLAHGLVPGNSDGLEVLFFAKPITAATLPDLLNDDATESKKGDYAALVLFLDKDRKVWQVNLSFVVPGKTVVRTIAWKPDELQKYFSRASFDGKRLALVSQGSFSEADSGEELKLSWDIDLDLPVMREVKR
jgi:hypothetical protein